MTKKPTQLHLMLPIKGLHDQTNKAADEDKDHLTGLVNKGRYSYREVIGKLSKKGLVKSRSTTDN